MSTSNESVKRRHILSSINPDRPAKRHRSEDPEPKQRSRSPKPTAATESAPEDKRDHDEDGHADDVRPRRTKLRLKTDRSRRHRSRDREEDESSRSSHRRHRHHHSHHRRRRHRSPTPPNPFEPEPLDPEAAFRESLFDAMADDEGAAYWEGVYGQPVHVYSNEKRGPAGELEQMTDEEYASYVRQKMWEKTNAGLLEERSRREEARKKKEQDERHGRRLQKEMEESLRKGDERRRRRQHVDRWEQYAKAWAAWDGSPETLPWPVDSGLRRDIAEGGVRAFFVQGLELQTVGETVFLSKLRDERVRWHPDKIQQRLGGQVDQEVMQDVTAVFQIIDRLWADIRSKA